MITGYNTDVKHNNRVFHIQTEDKGDTSPHIESLIYVGGQILATRKTSYADVVQEGRDDKAVQELMEQQHRTMIAAIQRGRFDGPNGALKSPSAASDDENALGESEESDQNAPGDRTLDQVILDYLASELAHDQIDCSFSPVPEFISGKETALRMKAVSSLSKQPVAGAAVQIRILSTVSKPAVVFQGKTASDGMCPISVAVPAFGEGAAAVVIRVSSPIGSTEFKFPVRRKN
ncbi:MAG: hypothetical protein M3S32_07305 [Acidobacteriota bacterium]|nr:hypothetical protein [Acidobacteriota bacterium]